MALYKNISPKAQYIVSSMAKVLVEPGSTVELSTRDMNHAGSALRFFESVEKATAVMNMQKTASLRRKALESRTNVTKNINENIPVQEEPVVVKQA